jgi:hypothetical protein
MTGESTHVRSVHRQQELLVLVATSVGADEDVDRLGELWNDGMDRFGGPFLAGKAFIAADVQSE